MTLGFFKGYLLTIIKALQKPVTVNCFTRDDLLSFVQNIWVFGSVENNLDCPKNNFGPIEGQGKKSFVIMLKRQNIIFWQKFVNSDHSGSNVRGLYINSTHQSLQPNLFQVSILYILQFSFLSATDPLSISYWFLKYRVSLDFF